jgi:hypothetical protein
MNLSGDQLTRRVRTTQLVCATLLCSVLVVCGICVVIVENNGPLALAAAPAISTVALVLLAFTFPLGLIVPNVMLRAAVQRIAAGTWTGPKGVDPRAYASDDARLLASRQRALVVSMALMEGSGTMGAMAYMLEGEWLALAAVGVSVVLMLWQFPTRASIRDWLERHLGLVTELRQLGEQFDVR